jgi:hypothetical protein
VYNGVPRERITGNGSEAMDFVDWCGAVLSRLADATPKTDPDELGFPGPEMRQIVLGDKASLAVQESSTYKQALDQAIDLLVDEGLVNAINGDLYTSTTRNGRVRSRDMVSWWEEICLKPELEPEEEDLLTAINRLSAKSADDHAWCEPVPMEAIWPELALVKDRDETNPYFQHKYVSKHSEMLEGYGLVNNQGYSAYSAGIAPILFKARYRGLVWETRRGYVRDSKFIDALVAEWETTSVDFKRELYTDTKDQKAELIKDLLGLANTQASGKRWMILGFDDKTRKYHGPPDKKITQNHLEQIIARHIEPNLAIRYKLVDYRVGGVGMLEVVWEPSKLPYAVKSPLGGEKKRASQGQIFVRHGSQTEEPTEGERAALIEEGKRAQELAIQTAH